MKVSKQAGTLNVGESQVWVNSANLTDESQNYYFSTFLAILKECFRQGL